MARTIVAAARAAAGAAPSGAARLLPGLVEPLFGAAVALRGRLYAGGWLRSFRPPVPVISVGNLTVGGTGKSPMVALVAGRLAARGARPVVLSRGYGGRGSGRSTVVSRGGGPLVEASVAGDEPVMLSLQLAAETGGVPVIVSPRRRDGAARAVEELRAGCLVLDDGFQHRSLARDLDILLLDGMDPFGNGRLLPAGPLREPPSAMERAGIVIVTQADRAGGAAMETIVSTAARHCPRAPLLHARLRMDALIDLASGRAGSPSHLRGARAYCFAGIARPERFFEEAARAGAAVAGTLAFPDHHPYRPRDLERILAEAARARADLLLTTEKDAARLGGRRPEGLYALRVRLEVDEGGLLDSLLDSAAGP